MENNQSTKEIQTKIKDYTLFIMLLIWICIPILKVLKPTALFAGIYTYKYMQIVGLIGICLFVFTLIKLIINKDDKKLLIKELVPIILLLGYLVWTFISCLLAQNKQNAFYGDTYRKEGFITYIAYAGFFSCAFLINSNKMKRNLLNIFIVTAIVSSTIIYLMNNFEIINVWSQKIFVYKNFDIGIFYNGNHFGYYLLLATSLSNFSFIVEKKMAIKIFYAISYIILLYFLIINNTFGCYIALFSSIILFTIYCIYKKKYRIFCAISLIIFLILSIVTRYEGKNIVSNNFQVFFQDIENIADIVSENNQVKNETNNDVEIDKESIEKEKRLAQAGSGRMKLWENGIKMILKHPIIGYGADNLEEEYKKYNIKEDRPHNLVIQLATTSGIPGAILYMCGVGLIIIRSKHKLEEGNEFNIILVSVIITYLISAIFGNSMYYTSPYFFILLGMLYKTKNFSKIFWNFFEKYIDLWKQSCYYKKVPSNKWNKN